MQQRRVPRLPIVLGAAALVAAVWVTGVTVSRGVRLTPAAAGQTTLRPAVTSATVTALPPLTGATASPASTLAPSTGAPRTTPALRATTPAPATQDPAPVVVISPGTRTFTVHVGTMLMMRLPTHPASASRPDERWTWDPPRSSNEPVLATVSTAAGPDGSASGSFRAVTPGDAAVTWAGHTNVTCSPRAGATAGPSGCDSSASGGRVTVTVVR
jgi:hypothetical protein